MRRDATTGRLTYHDGSGKVRLVTQESTRRGLSQGLDEPEFPVRVRHDCCNLLLPSKQLAKVHDRSHKEPSCVERLGKGLRPC